MKQSQSESQVDRQGQLQSEDFWQEVQVEQLNASSLVWLFGAGMVRIPGPYGQTLGEVNKRSNMRTSQVDQQVEPQSEGSWQRVQVEQTFVWS